MHKLLVIWMDHWLRETEYNYMKYAMFKKVWNKLLRIGRQR